MDTRESAFRYLVVTLVAKSDQCSLVSYTASLNVNL